MDDYVIALTGRQLVLLGNFIAWPIIMWWLNPITMLDDVADRFFGGISRRKDKDGGLSKIVVMGTIETWKNTRNETGFRRFEEIAGAIILWGFWLFSWLSFSCLSIWFLFWALDL